MTMAGGADDRWREADALFQEALDRPRSERADFLVRATADDPELRRVVEELLRVEAASSDFLSRPLDDLTAIPWERVLAEVTTMGSADPGAPESDRSGEVVGPYRLLRKLGRGGMATVYLAERADGLWKQRVALKLVRRGLDTDDVIRRFLAERQILSSLNHPNIASLLDGGTTERGLPYLVMEHVEGTPITDYCDEHGLGVEERLRLFCAVAKAVQHAHRSLVVHRDLKPSNILVKRDETGDARVKLLDFGIARILDPAEEAPVTRTGLRPLTPQYASPEQVEGEAITTASDVYQLGLLLCELLSGRRPYELRRVLSPARLRARLEEVEPAPPSTLVTPASAGRRGLSLEKLARRLRGDLDTIVLHALPSEPERRYSTAEALIEDVERHLEGLPIRARPATLPYRARKLLRRRPWLAPTLASALVVLVGFVVTVTRHSAQLEQERNLARLEAERAEEVRRLLVDLFRSADPYAPDGVPDADLTVREALAMGTARVRSELDGQPALQASLLSAVADVYTNLDRLEQARSLHEEALSLSRRGHGPRSPEVARELRKLGTLLARTGPLDSAGVLLGRSLTLTREAVGARDTAVAAVHVDFADLALRLGRSDQAEEHLITAVEILREREPPPSAMLAAAYTGLLDVYPSKGRLVEARAAAEEAVRLSRRAFGDRDPRTAVALVEAADLHDWEGRGEEAVPDYREAIRILEGALGSDHPRTLDARNNLAVTLRHLGDLEGAERVHRQIAGAWAAKNEPRPQDEADALQNLAVVLEEQGKLTEAEDALLRARDLYDRVLAKDHFRRAFPRLTLASVRLERREFAAAEEVAREATAILARTLPESSYVTATARCRLGRALAGQGHLAEARSLIEPTVEALARTPMPSVRYEIECRRGLRDLYRTLGEDEAAARQERSVRGLQAARAPSP